LRSPSGPDSNQRRPSRRGCEAPLAAIRADARHEPGNRMKAAVACIAALLLALHASAADFGSKGGPEPANIAETARVLRQDPYDMELLISFGVSKAGSAGHLALAIRDDPSRDDTVYSANFYADRKPEHASGFYTDDLIARIPKTEYLFGTTSSLGDTASFGLDFGEIFKRSVVGVRVYGVPASEKQALVAFFERVNADYHRRARNTEYHHGEVVYDYLDFNCAKAIGAAFKYGAGYDKLVVKTGPRLSARKVKAAVNANTPTEMAVKLLELWNARGYGIDVVLYRKYEHSTYVDPHEENKVAFKDLPNRFPSVLSLDYRREQGQYENYDNLFAMYLLYNLGKYSVRVNPATLQLEIEKSKQPMAYPEAAKLAARSARSDSRDFLERKAFQPKGTRIGAADSAAPVSRRDSAERVAP
jgi:hypothetical protein